MTNRAGLREPFPPRRLVLFIVSHALWLSPGNAQASAETVTITILHTTDVRGHVLSLRYREWGRHVGGLLRCGALVREIRREGNPVLLIDCGDFLDGSPESILSEGRLPMEAMNWLGYDARVPGGGDWRLLLGEPALEQHTTTPLLAANLDVHPSAVHHRLNHRRWLKKEMAGVRVAVVGLASPPDPETAAVAEPRLRWTPPDDALVGVLREVRTWRPDLLVLAAHYGVLPSPDEDRGLVRRWVRRYPEFDVVLGGSGGAVVRGSRMGESLAAQAGAEGRWLGRVDITFDRESGSRVRVRSDAIEVDAGVEEDATLRQALGKRLGVIEHRLDEILGSTKTPIGGAEPWPGQSALRTLLARSVLAEVKADVVLWGGIDTGHLHSGDIRFADILRAVPADRYWTEMSIPAVQLRKVLEENAAFLGTRDFLGIYGMRYDYAPGEAEPIRRLVGEDGAPPHGRKRLRVLVPGRFLRPGREGRERLRAAAAEPASRRRSLELDLPALVADYVRRHSPLRINAAPGMRVTGDLP